MESSTAALGPFAKFLLIGYYLGFHSTFWNRETNSFGFNQSRLRKLVFLLHFFLTNAYIIFLGVRVVQVGQNSRVGIQARFHSTYLFVMLNIVNVIFISGTLKNYNTLHFIIQSNIELAQKFVDAHSTLLATGIKQSVNVLQWMFRASTFVGCFAAMASGANAYRNPEAPILLSSLLNEPRNLPTVTRLILASSQYYFVGFFVFHLGFHFMTSFLWISCLIQILLGLRSLTDRHFDEKKQCYYFRILGVAQSNLVEIYGLSMLCIQIGGSVLVIWNLVQAVLFHSSRGVVVGFGCLLTTNKFQTSCSRLHEESLALFGSWNKTQPSPYFAKFRKSSKSIRVPIGTFFYFDRSIVLTTMSIILDNFVNLVVVFRSAA